MDDLSATLSKEHTKTFYRKVCLEDFLDESDDKNPQPNKYEKNHSYNESIISKNQQEFGHRKRIKP